MTTLLTPAQIGDLLDDDLALRLDQTSDSDPERGWVPAYHFVMVRARQPWIEMGRITLRVGNTHYVVTYAGHIGYRVYERYRGNHYAARSVRLLFPLCRRHGLNPLWITCNPDNVASRRSCELAGAEFVETVLVPPDTDMYMRGDWEKCRYKIEL
jgi:tagatose 1,6-diphosphate aldolase